MASPGLKIHCPHWICTPVTLSSRRMFSPAVSRLLTTITNKKPSMPRSGTMTKIRIMRTMESNTLYRSELPCSFIPLRMPSTTYMAGISGARTSMKKPTSSL